MLTTNNLSHWTRPRLQNNCQNLHRAQQIEGCEASCRLNDYQGVLKKTHIYTIMNICEKEKRECSREMFFHLGIGSQL